MILHGRTGSVRNSFFNSVLTRIYLWYFLPVLFAAASGYGQAYNPFIAHVMNETNIDSLEKNVRILSGEDSVLIGDTTVLITHRKNPGNDLAAEFIRQKLSEYNLEIYDSQYSSTGRNIYAVQPGTVYPDKYIIYCAHYDSKALFCADDNASGTAGVLEAARILSAYEFDYSIIYALWDEEEIGLLGSKYFAEQARAENMDITAVINFEMSGWDSNDDGLMDIHTRPFVNSVYLAELMYSIDSIYNLPLQPVIYNPGTGGSDHFPFWNNNYSAICFSEAYWGGDFNPYYHTSQDRIDKFNMNYYHNMAKLGTAVTAELASAGIVTGTENRSYVPEAFSLTAYPNPFNSTAIIKYSIPEASFVTIELFSLLGERINTLFMGSRSAGLHEQVLEISGLAGGTYIILLRTGTVSLPHKIIYLK